MLLPKQVRKLKSQYPEWDIETTQIRVDETEISPDVQKLLNHKPITITESGGSYSYQLLKEETKKEFRASYIFLDGSKLTLNKIKSLQELIIEKYQSGTPFTDLVAEYNMDGNSNKGDLGWFGEGMMAKEFEMEVKAHKKDDIFTVDVVSDNWYYVTLKTYDDRISKYLTLVKVKNKL